MSGDAFAPSLILLGAAALNEPRSGFVVELLEVFPHAGVNGAAVEFDDFAQMLPRQQYWDGGCVDDNLAVEQSSPYVRSDRFECTEDYLLVVNRVRVLCPNHAEFDFLTKNRIVKILGQFGCDEVAGFDVRRTMQIVEDLHRAVELRGASKLLELNSR